MEAGGVKVFLVVGMHRSATSLVAKGLHEACVHMGDDLLGATRSNLHGHYEDREAIRLNDEILKSAGGRWDKPPPHEAIQGVCRSVDLQPYIASRSARGGMWGVKDPRLSLTWPVWLPYLVTIDLHVIWARRGRNNVAESLRVRNGIPLERGRELADICTGRISLLMEAFDGRD